MKLPENNGTAPVRLFRSYSRQHGLLPQLKLHRHPIVNMVCVMLSIPNHVPGADERWKVYTEVVIDVAMLQEVHSNEGSDSVAVVDYPKMWTLTGHFLADGDQVHE